MALKLSSIVLLSSLIFVSVFGFLWMGGILQGVHTLCPFSMITKSDCVSVTSAFAFINHHVSVLQYLGRSLASFSFAILIVSVLSFGVFFFWLKKTVQTEGIRHIVLHARHIQEDEIFHKGQFCFLTWISLHNKQNPLLFFGVYDLPLQRAYL
ncbi:MAG: hypothetical protein HY445_02700 [Candidatus Niyogibacteria bacterium]|nr:hypothetical protein [Candidatus Niyogibacteria bacterium]